MGGILNVNDIVNIPNRDPITVLDRLKQLHPPVQWEVPEAPIHKFPERFSLLPRFCLTP